MRQLFLEKSAAKIVQVSQPILENDAIMISVHYSFLDSEYYKEHQRHELQQLSATARKLKKALELITKDQTSPLWQTLGNSCSGRVLAVGSNVKHIRPGDLVACFGEGIAYHADIMCVPQHLVVALSGDHVLKSASMVAIGARAIHALRRARLQLGEYVCVIGLGVVGQYVMQLAKFMGAKVIGIDAMHERIDGARKAGIKHVYDINTDDIEHEILLLTNYHGVDATIVTTEIAHDSLIKKIFSSTRKKGVVVLAGHVNFMLNYTELYQKEIDIVIACTELACDQRQRAPMQNSYEYVRWTEGRNIETFIELLEEGQFDIQKIACKEFGLHQLSSITEELVNRESLGIIIRYTPKDETHCVSATKYGAALTFLPISRDHLRVGVVGIGEFARKQLLPLLAHIQHVRLAAVVDSTIANALNAARTYSVAHTFVHDRQLLYEDVVDVVLIASPHKYHADQTLAALRHGKAVFLEKPLATTKEQLHHIELFIKEHPNVPLCVDYNRSFAPFIQKIKKDIDSRTSPLMIHYRMNIGRTDKTHWLQTDIGAGNIIGDACQIIDLFYELTGATVIGVSVDTVRSKKDAIFPTDNFCATLTFDDGSLASLLYSAIGHSNLGSERMEVFFDGKSIVVDNYTSIKGFGTRWVSPQEVSTPDKGHEVLLRLFFDRLREPQFIPPIPLQRLINGARLALIIDELACKGGGAQEVLTYD